MPYGSYCTIAAFALLTACENPVSTAITQAEQASVRVVDTAAQRTRGIIDHARRATEIAANAWTDRTADSLNQFTERTINHAARTVSATAIATEKALRRDILSVRTLEYAAKLRDTLTGAPLRQNLVQLTDTATNTALMRVERYQQKTVEQLNKQQKTWIETTYTLAAPILAAIGGLVIIAALGFGAVRSWQRLQERRHSRL